MTIVAPSKHAILDEIEGHLALATALLARFREISNTDGAHRFEPAPHSADPPREVLTPQQAAGRAGVSDSTIYRWLRMDESLGHRACGRWRVSPLRLDEKIAGN